MIERPPVSDPDPPATVVLPFQPLIMTDTFHLIQNQSSNLLNPW